MKKLMNILMLSCAKAAVLIEKKFDARLSLIERIQLSMHTSVCDACKTWEKESNELDESLKNKMQFPVKPDSAVQLSDDVKQRIIKKVEEAD